jgi:Methyl coenzyme M reductase, alpha subunit
MDLAHATLQKRLGKEVTPETISEYLHILNHAMPGGAVVQEHMVETTPDLSTTVRKSLHRRRRDGRLNREAVRP